MQQLLLLLLLFVLLFLEYFAELLYVVDGFELHVVERIEHVDGGRRVEVAIQISERALVGDEGAQGRRDDRRRRRGRSRVRVACRFKQLAVVHG